MPTDAAAAQTQLTLPPPIIVLGARPATTAMIGAILGGNPGAFAVPQLNLFVGDTLQDVITATAHQGPTHMHGLLRALAYIYGSEQTIISIGMARRWVMRRLSRSTTEIFDELRAQVAPRRLVDKSAFYSQDPASVERIRAATPDADFVHVIEHPLTPGAVTEPAEQRPRRGRARTKPPQDQNQWLEAHRLISAAMKSVGPERLIVLRAESLVADPHAELSALCARLHLPDDGINVAKMLHPENSPFAGFGPVGANMGDHPAFLRDPTFPPMGTSGQSFASRPRNEAMLPEVARLAARYGYD